MDIRTKIKNTKVGRPKTVPITPEVNEAYYRTAASRLNREIKGTKKTDVFNPQRFIPESINYHKELLAC